MNGGLAERVFGDGVTLALLSAMSGALVAQLPEFKPHALQDFALAINTSACVIGLCVSGMTFSNSVHQRSPWSWAALLAFIGSGLFFLEPQFEVLWNGGSAGLVGDQARAVVIKIVVLAYIGGWNGGYTLFRRRAL